jgi:Zn-dependent peptidase ImmA (M78 family)
VFFLKYLTEDEKAELYEEVYPIALKFRSSFINAQEVIEDTFKTIEQLGFLLIRFPAVDGDTSLGGFTIHKEPYDCIYINSRHNLGRQYMSCWHECYHIQTGEGSGLSYIDSVKQDPVEYKAELFAGLIMMPTEIVRKYIRDHNVSLKYLRHEDIIRMQNYFRVGYSAMLVRILQIFPEYKSSLQNRFAIAADTPEQREKLEKKILNVQGDLQLIRDTKDVYLPDTFMEDIAFNVKTKRISKEKAYELLKVIDGLKDDI